MEQETEQIRQEVSELSETNNLLKEKTAMLEEDREKLLSDNDKLEKQQKKLEAEIEKMVRSKTTMERNIYAYDEEKWQLPEPGVLMNAKVYRDKKALPLVKKLKEVIKALTIKCVQLTERGKKLAAKSERQEEKISRLTNRIMDQENVIDKLQEKTADLGRLEHCLGKGQVQAIIEQSKALEQTEKVSKHSKRVFEMDR